jgi:DoxX-like family
MACQPAPSRIPGLIYPLRVFYSDDPHGCFGCNIVVAGIINIIGRGTVKTDFARWGFPDGFNIVCGGLELVGAALLLPSSTRFWGLALLGMIMTGAIRAAQPLAVASPGGAVSGARTSSASSMT